MTTFILTLTITFVLLLVIGPFISFSKRRQRKTSHGLTGMCHETGGEMCGCCSSSMLNVRTKSRQTEQIRQCCDRPGSSPTTSSH